MGDVLVAEAEGLREAAQDCVCVERPSARSAVLLICEHASPRLPRGFGDLGLSREALASHIAWDPGALAVARGLSVALDATLIHQTYSRLIYDCNRPPDAAGAMPARSEIYDIPGNENIAESERIARTEALYIPFHAAVSREIALRKARKRETVIVTIHSFTPVYYGRQRAVEIGILHDTDSRFADAMLHAAEGVAGFRTERNEPYGPEDGVTHSLILHGIAQGLRNVMIEVRNDLLQDEAGQKVVTGYLGALIEQSLET
ncbi:N-formylglutamate amidohydrolase [Oryzifoliimicrobium ureilyticus]|uniref:N-formylglutamate amidohydrolase n=1 Tax=Oryzifoliimicrobium ureilyticus TaxID=3113724 RepID=UPI0030767F32